MGSDSHTSLNINIMFLWDMILCSLVDRYQRFRWRLQIQLKWWSTYYCTHHCIPENSNFRHHLKTACQFLRVLGENKFLNSKLPFISICSATSRDTFPWNQQMLSSLFIIISLYRLPWKNKPNSVNKSHQLCTTHSI